MNLAAVQQHFRDMSTLVQKAGASNKVVEELAMIAAGLDPFKEQPLGNFVAFLLKAEEFDRTGVLPVDPKRAKKPSTPRAPKAPKVAPEQVIQQVVSLYQNILTPTLTNESIEEGLRSVDQLKGTDLQNLANRLGVGEKLKKLKVKERATAIKQVVRDRRGMFERAEY